MTIDEQLAAVRHNLDMLTRIHLDNDREFRERMGQINEERQKDSREFRERLDRLTAAQEGNTRDIQSIAVLLRQDGENIRALARIAERHQERLDRLDPQ
jgi:hypothetical protein